MARKEKEVKHAVSNTDLFTADSGVGFEEGVDAGAYALPFLQLLQALSPQVQRGGQDYVTGAQPGMMMNSVTKEIFEEVPVSVVRRTHTFCRWTPRDDGGGFLGEYAADAEAVMHFNSIKPDDKGRRINSEGEEVTEHRNFYCNIVRADVANEPLLVSMTKSQLKMAREWNSNIALKSARVGAENQPVALSEVWRITTKLRTKGENTWFQFVVTHVARHTDPQLYAQVREGVNFAREQRVIPRQLEHIADDEPM